MSTCRCNKTIHNTQPALETVLQQEFNVDAVLPVPESVQKTSGYQADNMPVYFKDLIKTAMHAARLRCRPTGAYLLYPVQNEEKPAEGSVLIGNERFNCGKNIASRLQTGLYTAVFVCTIGSDYSSYIQEQHKSGEIVLSYIADIIASEAAEATAELLQQTAAENAAAYGLGVGERFSPGYCGWNVAEQRMLFRLLPDAVCGIQLSESCMMFPEKSVSGVFGLGAGMKRKAYRCSDCNISHCPVRRIRMKDTGLKN